MGGYREKEAVLALEIKHLKEQGKALKMDGILERMDMYDT